VGLRRQEAGGGVDEHGDHRPIPQADDMAGIDRSEQGTRLFDGDFRRYLPLLATAKIVHPGKKSPPWKFALDTDGANLSTHTNPHRLTSNRLGRAFRERT
jgi:hypothetical protein